MPAMVTVPVRVDALGLAAVMTTMLALPEPPADVPARDNQGSFALALQMQVVPLAVSAMVKVPAV